MAPSGSTSVDKEPSKGADIDGSESSYDREDEVEASLSTVGNVGGADNELQKAQLVADNESLRIPIKCEI